MYSHEILETARDDAAAHETAANAYRLLADYVTAGRGPDFEVDFGGDKGPCYGFDPQKMDMDIDADTTILIASGHVRSSVIAGAIWHFNSKPLAGRYRLGLVLHALQEYSETEMRRRICSVPFRSTFIHEFIHVLDSRRTDHKIMGTKPDSHNKAQYYNHPAEFNAFFHTFAEPWLDCLAEIQHSAANDASDLANIANITTDFAADVRRLVQQSGQSKQFFSYLTDDRRKAIMRRLFRLHQEITRESKHVA